MFDKIRRVWDSLTKPSKPSPVVHLTQEEIDALYAGLGVAVALHQFVTTHGPALGRAIKNLVNIPDAEARYTTPDARRTEDENNGPTPLGGGPHGPAVA